MSGPPPEDGSAGTNPPDRPRSRGLAWLRRAAPLGAVILAALLCFRACTSGIPGVTHSIHVDSILRTGTPRFSPDSSRFAYAMEVTLQRRAIGLSAFPDGGVAAVEGNWVEVFVYDLGTRQPPHRVFRRAVKDCQACDVVDWVQDGIHLWYDEGKNLTYLIIDPDRKSVRKLPAVAGRVLRDSLERHRPSRPGLEEAYPHLLKRNQQIFLWDPVHRTQELLYDLPLERDGHPVPYADDWRRRREEQRHLDAIHRIWTVRAGADDDSLRVILTTSVPRPDGARHLYRLRCTLSVNYDPTVPLSDYDREPEIFTAVRTLGPAGGQVYLAIPMREVRDALRTSLKAVAGRPAAGPGRTRRLAVTVRVHLVKVREPGDSGIRSRLLEEGDTGDAVVDLPVR